ncbi:hypothetical protein BGZ68_006339 [Mortierella alpina]|nr:hypothetical protein BGZ68_006339 [Mortierella alpina]
MRLTSPLTVLSVAALASAKILRNTASNLCLDAPGELKIGSRLTLAPCDKLENGDWSIDVLDEDSAIIRNNKVAGDDLKLCVALVEGPASSSVAELLWCSVAEHFDRVRDTNPRRWSFSAMVEGQEVALASDHSEVRLLPIESLQDGERRYEWTTLSKKTVYQELYSWMRYQL